MINIVQYSLIKFSIFNLWYISFKILQELLKSSLLEFVHNRVFQFLRASLDSGCRCTSSEHHLMVGSGILVVFHSVRTHLKHQKHKLGPVPISFQQGSSEFVLQVWQQLPKDYNRSVRIVQAIKDGISLMLLTFMCIIKSELR